MPPGKLASQAGHAFLDSYERCRDIDLERAELYKTGGHGTKVTLEADVDELLKIHEEAKKNGIPTALIIDSGHVMLPHFTGDPIITAVGIGPVYRHETPFLSHLKLVK